MLEAFGFEWHGTVEYQSHRNDHYDAALERLGAAGFHYACSCSRSQLARQALEPDQEPVYPGNCRGRPEAAMGPHALRYRIADNAEPVRFEDGVQGPVIQDCRREAGDFIIRRRDGQVAYHLAVVVDDELQGVTEVVRGADLLSSAPRQILLQRSLGCRSLRYAHLPLLLEADGRKLAKSRHPVPLAPEQAGPELCQVLGWLGLEPPAGMDREPVGRIWNWAIPEWRPGRLAGQRERRLPGQ